MTGAYRIMDIQTYKIYPNVKIGKNNKIDDYVIVGVPPRKKKAGELRVTIGDNAIIRSHTIIYAGNIIGDNFETGHAAAIREKNKIGDNVSIGTHSVVEHHVRIGNGVRIHSQAFIPECSIIEDGAWIGPNVVFTNVYHPRCPKAKECMKGPTIRKNARIGANATLLPDIIIGENALVGAGSVVVDDVPDNMVVAGVPAKVIKRVDELDCPYKLIDNPYGKLYKKK